MSEALRHNHMPNHAARGTIINPWTDWLENNSTEGAVTLGGSSATRPVTIDSATDPSANLLAVVVSAGAAVLLKPFGTDAAAEAFTMTVRGWKSAMGNLAAWYSDLLFVGATTLAVSAATNKGVSGGPASDTDFFCDTITQSAGTTTHEVIEASTGSFIKLDNCGYGLITVEFAISTAASANCLVGGF